ncbi:serine hydrolase [Caulobacter sp. DWP3-1-3b2]|uniref:serine hydrolase n=1 Tax=Caulobacter sp. DWP3-1-3b2 TaxID=2804643 RepID=UPI003CFBABCC
MIATTRRAALLSAFATVGAGALVATPRSARAAETGQAAAAIDLYAQQVMAAFPDEPGLGICVVEDGQITLAKGYGVKRMGGTDRVTDSTLFGVASNTKAFTAAALAMLVEAGKVEWDAPVTRYLPSFEMSDPVVTKLMTVRDLLCHRSGLTLGAGDLMIWPNPTHSRADIVAGMKHLPLGEGFRTGYAYDNVLYVVAGEVIAAVTGKPWEDFIQTRILDPLGMSDSVPLPSMIGDRSRAEPHARMGPPVRGLGPQTVLPFDGSFGAAGAAGGLNTSARDIGKWLQVQLGLGATPGGLKLWTEASSREMWKPHTITAWTDGPTADNPVRPTMQAYGLGWFIQDHRGERLLSHTGGLAGFISYTGLLPGRKSGIMVMTNAEEAPLFRALRYGGPDRLQGRADFDWIGSSKRVQATTDAKTIKDAAEAVTPKGGGVKPSLPLAAYVGTYRDPWYGTITVSVVKKGLKIAFDKTPALRGTLETFDGDTFRTRFEDRSQEDAFMVFEVKAGVVVGATMRAVSPLADFSYDYQDLRLTKV